MYMAIFDYHSDDPHHLNFTAGATLVVSQNAGGWLLGYLEGEGASKSQLWFPAAYAAPEPEPAPEPVPEPAPAQLRLPPGTRRKRPAVISVALEAAGTSDEVLDGMFALGTSTSFDSVNKNIEREVAHEMETEGLIASGSVVLVGGAENNDWVLDDKGHGPGWQRNKCAQEFGNSTLKYIQCLGDFSRYYRVTLETVIREFDGGHSGETTNYMSQLFADYKALEGAHKKLYATVATFWHTCKGEANINAQWIGIQPLINIFVDDERIAFLQGVHARVVGNFSKSLKAWAELRDSNDKARAIEIAACTSGKKINNFEFYLRVPLKTFARYELLFKQMLKLTPEHRSEEHAGLTTVLEKLEAIKSNANAVAAKMQQLETSYGGTPHTRTMSTQSLKLARPGGTNSGSVPSPRLSSGGRSASVPLLVWRDAGPAADEGAARRRHEASLFATGCGALLQEEEVALGGASPHLVDHEAKLAAAQQRGSSGSVAEHQVRDPRRGGRLSRGVVSTDFDTCHSESFAGVQTKIAAIWAQTEAEFGARQKADEDHARELAEQVCPTPRAADRQWAHHSRQITALVTDRTFWTRVTFEHSMTCATLIGRTNWRRSCAASRSSSTGTRRARRQRRSARRSAPTCTRPLACAMLGLVLPQ